MNVAIMAVDSLFPNLALMKISSWHKSRGDVVEWYSPFEHYDITYMAKIFSFTPDYTLWMTNTDRIQKGGTGYDLYTTLPEEMEFVVPDYSIYPNIDKKTSYGFLTRGCPNRCKWCVVPRKEGNIRPYMDVEDVAIDGRTNLILMDNNILASDYGMQQIEKIVDLNYRVDFNQAMDARLVTEEKAKTLAKVRWLNQIRFGCDTPKQIEDCERAMQLIDKYRGKPAYYTMYTMIGEDFNEAYHRLSYFRNNKHVRVAAQPFRDIDNPRQVIPQWQSDMARWATRREFWTSFDFKDFEVRKGFVCGQYFN